jgi:hypothetical protein
MGKGGQGVVGECTAQTAVPTRDADVGTLRFAHATVLRRAYSLPRYARTPWSGTQMWRGRRPACQKTSIGMPPRGWK